MKMPSINFNEGGRFLAFAFNYYNLALYIGLSIPYPWWSKKYRKANMDAYGSGWHIRYHNTNFVVYK